MVVAVCGLCLALLLRGNKRTLLPLREVTSPSNMTRLLSTPFTNASNSSSVSTSALKPTRPSPEEGVRPAPANIASRLRILHWNIHDGGRAKAAGTQGLKHVDFILSLVAKGGFDVATFNELNGFDGKKWQAVGERAGMPFTVLLRKSSYPLGIMARSRFRVTVQDRSPVFAHGLLCVELGTPSVEICVTHLTPHSSTDRLKEASRIGALVPRDRDFVLLGDLNTLSPLDFDGGTAQALVQHILDGPHKGRLLRKFCVEGQDGVWSLDFKPMRTLLAAPMHDLGRETAADAHTVPTAVNADHMHFTSMRLDYCMVNDRLWQRCRMLPTSANSSCSARVLATPTTASLSDHFPLAIELGAAFRHST